jgi:hypothetical protein
MASASLAKTRKLEPLAMQYQDGELQLQDSLGPELLKMLEDFGGVEDAVFGRGQAAVATALDSALYGGLEPFPEHESGVPLPAELMMYEQPASYPVPAVPHAPCTPPLDNNSSGAVPELRPPLSAFQQPAYGSGMVQIPATPQKVLPHKSRSIRRARSSFSPTGQPRSESEPQEVFVRRASSSDLVDGAAVSRQGIGSSPRSSTTACVPFSSLNAVEVFPEVSLLLTVRSLHHYLMVSSAPCHRKDVSCPWDFSPCEESLALAMPRILKSRRGSEGSSAEALARAAVMRGRPPWLQRRSRAWLTVMGPTDNMTAQRLGRPPTS